MPRKPRKQRVTLRFKRREQLKSRLRVVGVRSLVLALVAGFGAGLVSGKDSRASRFIQRHTPDVSVVIPPVLAGLPIQADFPIHRFWLWLPGSEWWLQERIIRRAPAVRAIRLQRHYAANHIAVQAEPRIPLVSWNGSGFDQEGVLFPMTPGTWNALPQAAFPPSADKRELSRWLARLASAADLWPQVASVREDASETMELTLKTGTVVSWGTLETESAARKIPMLLRVLDDAHKNLGGASRADLRFFEQGRIIVLPKGAR